MGLMDMLSPEGLIRAMGIDPAQMSALVNQMFHETAAAKEGFRAAVAHFDARLSAIQGRQERIEAQLAAIAAHLGIAALEAPQSKELTDVG